MAITFVGAGSVVVGVNSSIPIPTGYAVGDLLLLVCENGTNTAITTPSGWTLLSFQNASRGFSIFYKFAVASQTAPFVTFANGASVGVIVAYRETTAVDTISAYTSGTSTVLTMPTATLTTANNNEFVISIYGWSQLFTANATPSGSTTSRVNWSSSAGTTNGLLIADELQATAGASTPRSATLDSGAGWSTVAIAIAPSVELPRVTIGPGWSIGAGFATF
jgi:hypothetical protein